MEEARQHSAVTKTSAALFFVGWMVANLLAFGVRLFSGRPGWVRRAEVFCKVSQWLLGVVFVAVIAEGWWQEGPLHFAATPTSTLTVPLQDHGVKYVSPHDAQIIGFFDTLFYWMILPFLAAVIGELGLKGVNENDAKDRNGGISS